MPELPEVETLSRKVSSIIEGLRLTSATFYRPKLRGPVDAELFQRLLVNKTVQRVWRRSKFMIWENSDSAALFHFGMTGNILYQKQAAPVFPHTHAVFEFAAPGRAKGTPHYLHFVDPRRFGMIDSCLIADLHSHPSLVNLGVEPLDCKGLAAHLFTRSRNKKIDVKSFIMDGRIMVGVGNIYASESLFLSGLSPLRPALSLSIEEYRLLARNIKRVLSEAIASGGTTFRDFLHPDATTGYFVNKLKVYGREGGRCPDCGTLIMRCVQHQRSTFYCAECQH
jgi:formamidopyrimidine-DNA glycosylase